MAKVAVRPVDVNNLNHQKLARKLSDDPSFLDAVLLGVSGNNAQVGLKNTYTDPITIDDLAYTVSSEGHETSGKLPSPGTLQPNQESVLNVPVTSTSKLSKSSLAVSFTIRLSITATFGPIKVSFDIEVHN